jgi:hypothetical protein
MCECGLQNGECGIKKPGVSRMLQRPNLLPVPQAGSGTFHRIDIGGVAGKTQHRTRSPLWVITRATTT